MLGYTAAQKFLIHTDPINKEMMNSLAVRVHEFRKSFISPKFKYKNISQNLKLKNTYFVRGRHNNKPIGGFVDSVLLDEVWIETWN